MKKTLLLFTLFLLPLIYLATPTISKGAEVSNLSSLYDLKVNDINGQELSLSTFKGQVLLIANTASKCGFTSQYKDLEAIYEQYKDKNFSVLGFPSNDFLSQEPGTNEEVKNFCTSKFGVTFPLFSKAEVTGGNKQPLYRFLTELSGEEFTGEIKWNFEKFLIDRKGKVRARFGSFTNPSSSRITSKIEELLAES